MAQTFGRTHDALYRGYGYVLLGGGGGGGNIIRRIGTQKQGSNFDGPLILHD